MLLTCMEMDTSMDMACYEVRWIRGLGCSIYDGCSALCLCIEQYTA